MVMGINVSNDIFSESTHQIREGLCQIIISIVKF